MDDTHTNGNGNGAGFAERIEAIIADLERTGLEVSQRAI